MKRTVRNSLIISAVSAIMILSGCGGGKTTDKKVTISVGNWPSDESGYTYKAHQDWLEAMKNDYPDIEIIPDHYQYGIDTFFVRGASGQLPTIYLTWFTEVNKIVEAGYCADITDQMNENGYDKALNPLFKDLIQKDGKYYAVPYDAYAQGLAINKKLFREAGLINENGTAKLPGTYEELIQLAKIIKDKTGKAGFVFPTSDNYGGWHFMNIAWSYGVEFMKQNEDGTWKATFDSPECVAAMQYVKDLKWKYDVLPSEMQVSGSELKKQFAEGRVAMCFLPLTQNEMFTRYGIKKEDMAYARVPAGPEGRFAQMGGNIYMISNQASEEEKNAAFKWFETIGVTPKVSDRQIKAWKSSADSAVSKGGIEIGEDPIKLWADPERNEKHREAVAEFVNVNHDDFDDYLSFDRVNIKPEEPTECQQLYSVLDTAIQEVLSDKNSNVAAVVKKANDNFQTNFLDKVEK